MQGVIMTDAKPIVCTVKPAGRVPVGDYRVDFHSSCSVIDVTFPNVFYVEVGEIHFKNYYTAELSLLSRRKEEFRKGDIKWETSLKKMQLMPQPHCEQGGEDYFIIGKSDLAAPLQNITGLRFILRQPSPVWKDFKIDDLKLFKTSAKIDPCLSLPAWVTEASFDQEDVPERKLKDVPSFSLLSQNLQQLWSLSEEVQSGQPQTALNRFDIDGSYDVNLLSYT